MRPEADWNTDNAPPGGGAFDLKRIIWGRKLLVIICAVVGAAAGHYQLSKQPEVFSATGQVLLKRTEQAIPIEGAKDVALKDPLEEHMELLRKGSILDGAAKRLLELEHPVPTLTASKDIPTIAAALARRISVSRPNPKLNFLNITFTSPHQPECQPAVEAIIASYEEYLTEDQKRSADLMVARVEEAKNVLDGDLKRKRDDYRQFRARTSLVLNGTQGQNLHQQRVLEIEAERRQLMIRETDIKAELQAIESAKRRGTSLDVLRLLADSMASQGTTGTNVTGAPQSTFLSQIMPLQVEKALLEEKLGAGHPDVKAITRKIEVMQGLLNPGTEGKSTPTDFLDLYVKSLEEELRVIVEKATRHTAMYMEEQIAARALGEEEAINSEMLDDIQRTQQLYDQVLQKLDQVNLVKSNDNFSLERITPAGPGRLAPPNPQQFYAMGTMGGVLVALLLSFLIELSDRGFKNPLEIHQFLGMPVIGHIPLMNTERGSKIVINKEVDTNLAVYQRPKSRVSEAYRGVRTSLMFGLKDKTHTVIQVTSPDPGDGKSTLSANLAAALAISGKRVILIDCDLRKPKQHKQFSQNLEKGVTAVISGKQTIEEATLPTPVQNLWLMTAGPRTDHPGELLLKAEFNEMLKKLKQEYDFVIVDTPPVLPVTDAATIAPLVDGVILVFKITKFSRPHATQALQALQMVDANMLGVVVNSVKESHSYSYSGGDYGYGGRYGSTGYGRYEYREKGNSRDPRLEQRIAN